MRVMFRMLVRYFFFFAQLRSGGGSVGGGGDGYPVAKLRYQYVHTGYIYDTNFCVYPTWVEDLLDIILFYLYTYSKVEYIQREKLNKKKMKKNKNLFINWNWGGGGSEWRF